MNPGKATVESVTTVNESLKTWTSRVVSKVLILSTGGIRLPPNSVASLIFVQENKISRLVVIVPSVRARYFFFTIKIYAGVDSFTYSRDRYRVVNTLLNRTPRYTTMSSFLLLWQIRQSASSLPYQPQRL